MSTAPGLITQLPEELIEIIIRKVRNDIPIRTFWDTCMRVCRQWHRIGLGPYKALGFAIPVTLESSVRGQCGMQEHMNSYFPLVSDFEFRIPSELYLSQLRSFSIHIRHQCVAVPFNPEPGVGIIDKLGKSFAVMRNLTTFSVKFSDGWDYDSLDIPAVPQSFLAEIVAILPDTVVDLEMDTACADIPPSQTLIQKKQESHVCYQISRIIRRLHHLRLRMGHVCPELFGFIHSAASCDTVSTCDFCSVQESPTCQLIRTWHMRSLVVWLPRETAAPSSSSPCAEEPSTSSSCPSMNQRFLTSTSALLSSTLHNPTRILLIHQTPFIASPHYGDTQPPLLWNPQSNISTTISARLPTHFSFHPISIKTLISPPTHTHTPHIHEYNLSYTPGNHNNWPEPGNATIYTHLALATLEGMMGWTMRSWDSYRFPMSESEQPNTPFFKHEALFYCPFPQCCAPPSQSLVALRGHTMYAHGSARLERGRGVRDAYVAPPQRLSDRRGTLWSQEVPRFIRPPEGWASRMYVPGPEFQEWFDPYGYRRRGR